METLALAKEIAQEALDTKAQDLKLLDLRDLVSYTDYFILATGTSDRHVKSIADRVHLKVKKKLGRLPISYEGLQSGQWVLLDYGDVVLHVFLEEQRKYYGLDAMWADAPVISMDGQGPAAKAKPAKKAAAKPKKRTAAKRPAKPAKKAPAKKSPAKKKKSK
ncbi:ribosome silencing factor [bacterium]|nr:MAG: ribosome silencing factor [bacterium]